jgi:hypothetical protein
MKRDCEISWAAGLFEGEGCILMRRGQGCVSPSIRLVVSMTDEDVLERFRAIVECGPVRLRRPAEDGKKAVYTWEIGNRPDVERLLRAFLPWLGRRRSEKANLALAECAAMDRNCILCGAPFRGKRSDSRWCSDLHRHAWWERKRRAEARAVKLAVA